MADVRYNLYVLQGGEWELEEEFGPGTRETALETARAMLSVPEGAPEGVRVMRAVTRASGLQEAPIFEHVGPVRLPPSEEANRVLGLGRFMHSTMEEPGEKKGGGLGRLVQGSRAQSLTLSVLALLALIGLFVARESGVYDASSMVLFGTFLLIFSYPAHLFIQRWVGGGDPARDDAEFAGEPVMGRSAVDSSPAPGSPEASANGGTTNRAPPAPEGGSDGGIQSEMLDVAGGGEAGQGERPAEQSPDEPPSAELMAALYYNRCIVVIGADMVPIAAHLRLPLALFLFGAFQAVEQKHGLPTNRLVPMLQGYLGGSLEAIGCDLRLSLHQEVMRAGGLAWKAGPEDTELIRTSLTTLFDSWPTADSAGQQSVSEQDTEILVSAVWVHVERASAGDTTRDSDINLFSPTAEEWREDPGVGGWASFPSAEYALEKLIERLYREDKDEFSSLRIGIDCHPLGDMSPDGMNDRSVDLCRRAKVGECLVSRKFRRAMSDPDYFEDLGYMVVDESRELIPVFKLRPKFMAARNISFDPSLTGDMN